MAGGRGEGSGVISSSALLRNNALEAEPDARFLSWKKSGETVGPPSPDDDNKIFHY